MRRPRIDKHALKLRLRSAYARFLFASGLHAVLNRLMPARLVILAGHRVADEPHSFLPDDMRISRARLERILSWFRGRYETCTVGDGVRRLRNGARGGIFALSMDDGYRDNRDELLPLLDAVGVPATVYVETRPLDERRVNWTHKYFWILARIGEAEFVERYRLAAADDPATERLAPTDGAYRLKRVLKYEAGEEARDRALDGIFRELGGDERELCDELYLHWEDARALRDAGVEIGCHTVSHAILERLPSPRARQEIGGGSAAMREAMGAAPRSFAYPFGRPWDFKDDTVQEIERAGFWNAVTTDEGVNVRSTDPMRLHRIMIDDSADLPRIVAEACGGFLLLRWLGINL